jgi:hypothetical protein
LDSKAESLCDGFKKFFANESEKDVEIFLSWDHLPFVQVMEMDREKLKEQKLKNLDMMLKMGITQDEAIKYLDLNFKPFQYGKSNVVAQETVENGGASGESESS